MWMPQCRAGQTCTSQSPRCPQGAGAVSTGTVTVLRMSGRPLQSCPEHFTFDCSTCCSAAWSCPTLYDPMSYSTPGFPVLQHLPEFAQTHVHESVMPSNHLIFWLFDTLVDYFQYLGPSVILENCSSSIVSSNIISQLSLSEATMRHGFCPFTINCCFIFFISIHLDDFQVYLPFW